MRPATPDEYIESGKSFEREGMMFVGDKGKIIGGFRGESPVLYADNKVNIAQVSGDKNPERRPE